MSRKTAREVAMKLAFARMDAEAPARGRHEAHK